MTEQEARELIAKACEQAGRYSLGHDARHDFGNGSKLVSALLPLLATSELQRRALEACETMADSIGGMGSVQSINADYHRARNLAEAIGRESLAAKKPKGPWRQDGHRAIHESGRSRRFYDEQGRYDPAACSEFVAEQNEREAAR